MDEGADEKGHLSEAYGSDEEGDAEDNIGTNVGESDGDRQEICEPSSVGLHACVLQLWRIDSKSLAT